MSSTRGRTDEVRLIRASELCANLGISRWTLNQWIRRGQFPRPVYINDGAPMRFRVSEIERWIESRQRKRRKPIRRGKLKRGTE